MRQTPAQRHRMHRLALQQAELAHAANAHGQTTGTAYELQLAQLHQHRLRLKDLQSVEKKVEVKRALLPEYDAYLDGVLQARPGTQDDVLTTLLVWHIDAGSYRRALQLAEYALAFKLTPPDSYQRDLATIVQDEVGEAIANGKLQGPEAVEVAHAAIELTAGADTPDQAKAKLFKAAAWAHLGKTSTNDVDVKASSLKACKLALPLLQRALQLDSRVGVKKDIERLERRLSKTD